MKAKEMFEKLGFYITNEKPLTYQNDDGGYIVQILFNRITQGVQISEWEEYNHNLPQGTTTLYAEHFKAINKQIEELGWDNESN